MILLGTTINALSVAVGALIGVLLSNLMLTEKSNVPILNLILALILICGGITILNYRKDSK